MIILKEVGFASLVKNTKYVIKRFHKKKYNGRFMGYYYYMDPTAYFENVYEFKTKRDICKVSFHNEGYISYYTLDSQKEQIQDAMELRAINQVLQRITGDLTFNY